MPGHDDHEVARRFREERVEASEESMLPQKKRRARSRRRPRRGDESTPPEASEETAEKIFFFGGGGGEKKKKKKKKFTPGEGAANSPVGLALVLVAGAAALAGVAQRIERSAIGCPLPCSTKARDSSAAALDSSTEALRSVGGRVRRPSVGAVAGTVGAVPSALWVETSRGALQQAQRLVDCGASLRGRPALPRALPERQAWTARPQAVTDTNVSSARPTCPTYVSGHAKRLRLALSRRSSRRGAIYPVPAGGCP